MSGIEIVYDLRKNIRQRCKEAQKKVTQCEEEYNAVKKKYIYDDEQCLIDDAKINLECAKTKLNTLVQSKIDIEIAYRKIKAKYGD